MKLLITTFTLLTVLTFKVSHAGDFGTGAATKLAGPEAVKLVEEIVQGTLSQKALTQILAKQGVQNASSVARSAFAAVNRMIEEKNKNLPGANDAQGWATLTEHAQSLDLSSTLGAFEAAADGGELVTLLKGKTATETADNGDINSAIPSNPELQKFRANLLSGQTRLNGHIIKNVNAMLAAWANFPKHCSPQASQMCEAAKNNVVYQWARKYAGSAQDAQQFVADAGSASGEFKPWDGRAELISAGLSGKLDNPSPLLDLCLREGPRAAEKSYAVAQ